MSRVSGLITPVWHPNIGNGMDYEGLNAFNFLAENFSARFWAEIFWKQKEFSNKFVQYLKFSV